MVLQREVGCKVFSATTSSTMKIKFEDLSMYICMYQDVRENEGEEMNTDLMVFHPPCWEPLISKDRVK